MEPTYYKENISATLNYEKDASLNSAVVTSRLGQKLGVKENGKIGLIPDEKSKKLIETLRKHLPQYVLSSGISFKESMENQSYAERIGLAKADIREM